MPETLLQTKLHVPPLRPDLVNRPHLLERLNQAQRPGLKLALVSAPAGSGKTTLLSQFVAQVRLPVAWLSLDKADDDPNRFWTYLITACQSVLDEMGESALALLGTPQPLSDEAIPTLLINDLARQKREFVLFLDDYHAIQNPSIHQSLSFLLDYLPDNLHIVVSTRIDPPWPLARYRARNQLVEIRAYDLRFSSEEAAEFLNQMADLNLSAEEANALLERTEGWAVGLQLAAIAMQTIPSRENRSDIEAFIRAFTGSHLYVAEYLLEEVLKRQPADVQSFLLETSILDELNAELCDAVTGRQDSRGMLAALQRANLFVFPLDAEGRWFRYHHLFADLLQARLSHRLPAGQVNRLHLQAATWFKQNNFIVEAVRHTLEAQAFERAAQMVEQEARAMMFSGRANTLRGWLAALPEESLQAHPRLYIYRLWIDLMQETLALSARFLRESEKLLRALPPSPENDQLQVELMAVLCRFVAFAGDTTRAIRLADEALARLPEGEMAMRARAYSALAVAYWIEGKAEAARQAYDQCMPLAQATGNYSLAAHATMMMAISHTDYGRLGEAARTYQSIIDMGKQTGQEIFFPAGQGYIGLAGIHLERNELDTAEDFLQRGMALCRQGGLAGLSTGHMIKARLHQARGELQRAVAELELMGETGIDPSGMARHIHLRLAMGDIDAASRLGALWTSRPDGDRDGPQPPLLILEIIKLTLARLCLARGELERAGKLLDEVQDTAGPGQRSGRLIEVYLLRSLVSREENRGIVTPGAIEWFSRALEMAAPEGYILLFLENGPAVIPLLQAATHRPGSNARLKQYAQQLLDASQEYGEPALLQPPGTAPSLVEQLTPREMEVLQLVAMGDTNQVIAGKLVITVRTVKKHITNILGKLAVSNRTQAVVRARELGLITSE